MRGNKSLLLLLRLAVFMLICIGFAAGQTAQEAAQGAAQDADANPKVSGKPLTAEQLAVYRAVLGNWMEHDVSSINLAVETIPLQATEPGGSGECAKGLDLEPAPSPVVHRFRMQDLSRLGRNIALVDPTRQRKEVQDNDPERTAGQGKSIEDAVRNGFAHGLVTLSEIRFDRRHKSAIVSYGFYCGRLCGNGGTVVLEKLDGFWARKARCDDWISRLALPPDSPPKPRLSSHGQRGRSRSEI